MGHTHEKVDRDLFATIGTLKKMKNCQTPAKFPKFVLKGFRKSPRKPSFRKDPIFWDWKSFFGEEIRQLENLASFRAFLIKCDELDQPVLFYKKNILELTWLGFEGSLRQGIFLKNYFFNNFKGIQILREIPDGFPEVIPPTPISSQALADFPKFLEYLKPKDRTWWETWLQDSPLPSDVVPEGNPFINIIYS